MNSKDRVVHYVEYETKDQFHDNSVYFSEQPQPSKAVTFESLRKDLQCKRMEQSTDEEIAEFFYHALAFIFL